MIAANYGPVADIEILWTLIALVGAGFSYYNVRDALEDWRTARDLPGNGRKWIAAVSLRLESARMAIQLIFALIGFLAMLLAETEPSLQQPWHVTAIGVTIRWGLIVCSVLIFMQSVENRRLRQHFMHVPQPEGGST